MCFVHENMRKTPSKVGYTRKIEKINQDTAKNSPVCQKIEDLDSFFNVSKSQLDKIFDEIHLKFFNNDRDSYLEIHMRFQNIFELIVEGLDIW